MGSVVARVNTVPNRDHTCASRRAVFASSPQARTLGREHLAFIPAGRCAHRQGDVLTCQQCTRAVMPGALLAKRRTEPTATDTSSGTFPTSIPATTFNPLTFLAYWCCSLACPGSCAARRTGARGVVHPHAAATTAGLAHLTTDDAPLVLPAHIRSSAGLLQHINDKNCFPVSLGRKTRNTKGTASYG